MLEILRRLGWLFCCVYATIPAFWLMIHPRVEYWRSRHGSPYRVLLPAWVGMWIVFVVMTAHWRNVVLYDADWVLIPALFLFAAGIGIYRLSGSHFSFVHLSGLPELRPMAVRQSLVTSGLHSRVRHPMYLGHLCEMLAWSLATGLVVCYGLTAFAILTGGAMVRMEDCELESRFGEAYRQYRRKVPAILPRI